MRRRSGFTLIELCVGMAVTAIVASAVATFSLAVSQNWQVEQHNQRLAIGAQVIAGRIRSTIQSAKLVGGCEAGSLSVTTDPAGIMLWTSDSNGDGLIQGSETAMLYYDPTSQQLRLYSGGPSETSTWSYSNAFNSSPSVGLYRSGRSSTLIADNVTAFAIDSTGNSSDATARVSLAFQLSVSDGQKSESIVHYCTIALRAPAAIPSN